MNLPSHAFCCLLAHGANEGIRTGRFDPIAPSGDPSAPRTSVRFDAQIGSIPMRVSISDWRLEEASISVAAWPTPDVDEWIDCMTAKAAAGDVTAIGYLERRDGRMKLSNPFAPAVFMRKHRIPALLGLPMPSDASDPLQLYPRYLSFGSAA